MINKKKQEQAIKRLQVLSNEPDIFPDNIVLIGFMGTGKSTIAKCLHTYFYMEVVEMDEKIAEQEKMSVSDIFRVHGEEYFRSLETQLLIRLQTQKHMVISCGGGVPMRDCNVAEMKKNGVVVLLTAKPETILERVKDDHGRPILENNKSISYIEELLEVRKKKYAAAADLTIMTDGKSAEEICAELAEELKRQ